LTGRDWIEENESDVETLCELLFSKVSSNPTRWVLVVPEDSPVRTVKDLQGKVVATEAVNMTRRFLKKHGVEADVEFSWGATEVKVPDLVDAIVEGTETGTTLRAHGLRIVDTLLESTPRWIANRTAYADPWKREKMENLAMLLRGALEADGMVGLKMNVPRDLLEGVLALLPAMKRPTISALADAEWVAVETILPEETVRDLIPALK